MPEVNRSDLPNFSLLVTVLRNQHRSLTALAAKTGISKQTLQAIEDRLSLDPKFSKGMKLIELAVETFGEAEARKYMETP